MDGRVNIVIANAQTPAEFLEARRLFEEYVEEIGLDLSFQNFASELEALPDVYGPPKGCLLLARRNGAIVGCVALRPFEKQICELKRMYVRPSARGQGVARELVRTLIGRAKEMGYNRMVLDTLASMLPARELYRSLGFGEVAPYYENPIEDVVYMKLDLGD